MFGLHPKRPTQSFSGHNLTVYGFNDPCGQELGVINMVLQKGQVAEVLEPGLVMQVLRTGRESPCVTFPKQFGTLLFELKPMVFQEPRSDG